MDMFHVIEDAVAIVRKPKGVYTQSKMYHRGSNVYVAYGAGFIKLGQKFGEHWGTSHPDIKIVDFEATGIRSRENPTYGHNSKIRAVA